MLTTTDFARLPKRCVVVRVWRLSDRIMADVARPPGSPDDAYEPAAFPTSVPLALRRAATLTADTDLPCIVLLEPGTEWNPAWSPDDPLALVRHPGSPG